MDEPWVVIELDKPIQAHGEELIEIPLQEPTVKQLKGIRAFHPEGIDIGGHMERIISQLGGIPLSAAEKIPLSKLMEAGEKFSDFLERFR